MREYAEKGVFNAEKSYGAAGSYHGMGYRVHEIGSFGLLQYRMGTAPTVVSGRRITAAVVVVEHEMFALVTDVVGELIEFPCYFGDE